MLNSFSTGKIEKLTVLTFAAWTGQKTLFDWQTVSAMSFFKFTVFYFLLWEYLVMLKCAKQWINVASFIVKQLLHFFFFFTFCITNHSFTSTAETFCETPWMLTECIWYIKLLSKFSLLICTGVAAVIVQCEVVWRWCL